MAVLPAGAAFAAQALDLGPCRVIVAAVEPGKPTVRPTDAEKARNRNRAPDKRVAPGADLVALRHEIANPLMTITASAELALRQDKRLAAATARRLRQILGGCEEIARILSRIRPRPAHSAVPQAPRTTRDTRRRPDVRS